MITRVMNDQLMKSFRETAKRLAKELTVLEITEVDRGVYEISWKAGGLPAVVSVKDYAGAAEFLAALQPDFWRPDRFQLLKNGQVIGTYKTAAAAKKALAAAAAQVGEDHPYADIYRFSDTASVWLGRTLFCEFEIRKI